ncbi:hypothetical protein VTO42DRAFT_2421 [Malbranchea cinnamomea]
MRQSVPGPLLLLTAFLLKLPATQASPFPIPFVSHLVDRACENPCGYYGQLCCSASEVCTTDSNGQAACAANADQDDDDGQWEYFTITYVQTDYVTVTSTGSRWVAEPTSDNNAQCRAWLGESSCGDICCSAAEACEDAVCVEAGNSPIDTGGPSPTPPLRPTSTTGATVTVTQPPPTTVPFIPAIGTDGNIAPMPSEGGGSLSGGAIAGIVIGSLAGAFILLLLCCCFCVGSTFDRLRALLGLKGGNRSSSYTGSSRSSHHAGWFGAGPARPKKDKKSGLFGLGGIATLAVIIGAIAVCLGLKRKNKERSEKSYSYYTPSSYYTYSYYTSSSSSSSSSSRPSRPSRPSRSR